MKTYTVQLSLRSVLAITALYFTITISSVLLIWEVKEQWASRQRNLRGGWGDLLDAVMSPDAATLFSHDTQLRRRYLEAVELTSHVSRGLASRYRLPGLEDASNSLDLYRRTLDLPYPPPFLTKRQGLFGFGAPATPSSTATPAVVAPGANPLEDIGASLLAPLTDAFSNIGNDILNDLSGGAIFLGIGIGAGAAQGLDLADAHTTNTTSRKTAADNGMQATGLNPAIQNLGLGAAATLLGSVNLSSLAGPAALPLGPTARSLAEGLANGTVAGLRLGLAGVALTPPPDEKSLPSVAGNFGFGLSNALATSVNLTALAGTAASTDTLLRYLPAAAAGLGQGLGEGIPVGLGLQPDAPVVLAATAPGTIDAGGVARGFGKGFVSRLLANGTAGRVVAGIQEQELGLPAVDMGRAAQGFARGLLQGAGEAVESIGGVAALMNGTAHAPVGGVQNATLVFDDGVGGAAVGFGLGLGGQGVLVARELLQGVSIVMPGATPARKRELAVAKRQVPGQNVTAVLVVDGSQGLNLSVFVNANTLSFAAQVGVSALTCQGVGGLVNILLGLAASGTLPADQLDGNGTSASFVKQGIPSGIISFKSPRGDRYEIDGQQVIGGLDVSLVAAAGGVKINGMGAVAFAVLLILHILFAVVAFLDVLPLAVGLESTRNILVRIKFGHVLPNAPRWVSIMWFAVFAPAAVLTLVFVAIAMGNRAHFQTAHGVLGLLTVLLSILAIGLHYFVKSRSSSDARPFSTQKRLEMGRNVVNQLLLILALATSITGFMDLSAISLCVTQVISIEIAVLMGFGLAGIFTLGSAISGLELILRWRWRQKRTASFISSVGEKTSPLA